MHHSQAAVWEENRDGEIVNAARVHQLLLMITNKCWSKEETELALAREISEGSTTKQKDIEIVQTSTAVSAEGGREGYMLAPVKEEILRIATGVGSHTTCVLPRRTAMSLWRRAWSTGAWTGGFRTNASSNNARRSKALSVGV